MRAFLSYDIDDDAFFARIRDVQQELLSTGADLKLVNPKSLHFTVRFLGEIDEKDKDEVISALRGHVENFELPISFRGLGTFPDERRISVIWVGIDPKSASEMEGQAAQVNKLLSGVHTLRGVDDEKFSAHVTIARMRSGKNKENLVNYIRENKEKEFGSTKIQNLRLKLSTLTSSGPEYSDLHVFAK